MMSLMTFYEFLNCRGYIAKLLSSARWKAPNRTYASDTPRRQLQRGLKLAAEDKFLGRGTKTAAPNCWWVAERTRDMPVVFRTRLAHPMEEWI